MRDGVHANPPPATCETTIKTRHIMKLGTKLLLAAALAGAISARPVLAEDNSHATNNPSAGDKAGCKSKEGCKAKESCKAQESCKSKDAPEKKDK